MICININISFFTINIYIYIKQIFIHRILVVFHVQKVVHTMVLTDINYYF